MFETLIGVVLGAVVSILVTIWVENLRRPKLRISIEPPGDFVFGNILGGSQQPMQYWALRVRVSNKQPTVLAGWIERGAALGCRGAITFHRLADGNFWQRHACSLGWWTTTKRYSHYRHCY